jgi:Flp pilus assembly protein TadD
MSACWQRHAKWLAISGLASLCLAQAAYTADTPTAAPALPHFDPTNPIVLNEYAVQKALAGDISTAIILLKRALLIAPYDARIRRNLDVLRALQAGKSAQLPATIAPPPEESAPSQPGTGTDDGLPQVPLWPSQ